MGKMERTLPRLPGAVEPRRRALVFLVFLGASACFAQDFGLPNGAINYLGQGSLYNASYSHDGSRLAVSTGAGIWLYDTETYEASALLKTHSPFYGPRMVFAPGKRLLATSAGEGTISLWDATNGERKLILSGHGPIAFSPDGKLLATGGRGSTARVWNPLTGEELLVLRTSVSDIEFSRDGLTLVTGSAQARLWDASTGKELRTFEPSSGYAANVALSPDGTLLATHDWDDARPVIRIWDVETENQLVALSGHSREIRTVVFSPDGTVLVSGGVWGDQVFVWDMVSLSSTPRFILNNEPWTTDLEFLPGGLLAAGSRNVMRVWDVSTGDLRATVPVEDSILGDVFFDSYENQLAVGSTDGKAVHILDAQTYERQVGLGGYSRNLYGLGISPDGGTVTTIDGGSVLEFWDVETGELLTTADPNIKYHPPIHWSSDGTTVYVGASPAGSVGLLSPDGTMKAKLTGGDNTAIRRLVFSPDGETLATVSHNSRRAVLWDVWATQPRSSMTLNGTVYSLDFSPDGETLATTTNKDRSIVLWDVPTGTKSGSVGPVETHSRSLTYLPTGLLACAVENTTQVWDPQDNSRIAVWEHSEQVHCVKLSPNGDILISVAFGDVLRLWDAYTLEPLSTIQECNWHIPVAFTPDQSLMIGTRSLFSKNIMVWDTSSGTAVDSVGSHLERISDLRLSRDGSVLVSSSSIYGAETIVWDMSPFLSTSTAVELTGPGLTDRTVLLPNYPNPFNTQTQISYRLGAVGPVTLSVYNLVGQRVATLVDEFQEPGTYNVSLDGRSLGSGVFLVRLSWTHGADSRRILLIR